MRLIKTSLLALVIAAAGTALPAQAATDTTTFNVKIVITESCDIHTTAATDVDFGTHARSTTAQQTATGTLTVNCTDGTPYNIGLDNGDGGGVAPARYDQPYMPNYAWPSYAAYPNYAQVAYPRQYSPTAWPYIGPFYPYPQVPPGWRKVTLEWDDGWWMLDFKDHRHR